MSCVEHNSLHQLPKTNVVRHNTDNKRPQPSSKEGSDSNEVSPAGSEDDTGAPLKRRLSGANQRRAQQEEDSDGFGSDEVVD